MLNAGDMITDAMLQAASHLPDIDDAFGSVMEQVGIDDGGVADMEIGHHRDEWATATHVERRMWLWQWRDAEINMDLEYPLHKRG